MAKKPCCICKKLVGFIDRNELTNGYICDDCWTIVRAAQPGMKVSYLFSVEQVINAYNSASFSSHGNQTTSESGVNYFYNPENLQSNSSVSTQNSPYQMQPWTYPSEDFSAPTENKYSLWDKLKIIGSILSVIGGLVIAWFCFTTQGQMMFMDIMASISPSDNAYVSMVQNLRPLDDGRSYKSAFDNTFSNNEWYYYKSGGTRYVKVTSYDDNPDDKLITKFSLEPTGEKGKFWIEPYSMEANGYTFSQNEMLGGFAVLFGQDIIEELLSY